MPPPVLKRGQIVLVEVLDPQGRNPKIRPALIVTATEAIKPGEPFQVVAITGQVPRPLPEDCVALPYVNDVRGHPRTLLKKPSVAKCSWLEEVREEDVRECKGVVYGKWLLDVLEKVEALRKGKSDAPLDN